jgi:hypothetical protein
MNTDLQHAHKLLSHLAPDQVAAIEDEEISAEEEQAVAEGREWLKHNKPIPHEEVLADFGLTMADFERMGQTPLPTSDGPAH